MVRIFLKSRYTAKTCNDSVTKNALRLFQGFQYFGRSKVIHSAAVWLNPGSGKLYSMNINELTPRCREDFWTLNFLRTYADCILTTGQILRKEPNAFHPDIPEKLGLPKDIYYKKGGKPLAIMTRGLQSNLHLNSLNPVYQNSQFKKHILVKPQVLDRFR